MDGAALGTDFSTAVVLFHEAVGQRLGLSAADHKAFGQIRQHGPLTAGALATRLHLTPGAVTALLDRLETRELITRTEDPQDRRRTVILALGAPDLSAIFAELQRESAEFGERFDEADWRVIIEYLTGMTEILRHQTERLAEDPSAGRQDAHAAQQPDPSSPHRTH